MYPNGHFVLFLCSAGMVSHPPVAISELTDHTERLKANDNLKFSQEYEVGMTIICPWKVFTPGKFIWFRWNRTHIYRWLYWLYVLSSASISMASAMRWASRCPRVTFRLFFLERYEIQHTLLSLSLLSCRYLHKYKREELKLQAQSLLTARWLSSPVFSTISRRARSNGDRNKESASERPSALLQKRRDFLISFLTVKLEQKSTWR